MLPCWTWAVGKEEIFSNGKKDGLTNWSVQVTTQSSFMFGQCRIIKMHIYNKKLKRNHKLNHHPYGIAKVLLVLECTAICMLQILQLYPLNSVSSVIMT